MNEQLHDVKYCTKCNKSLKEMKFFVSLVLSAFHEKESGSWENIPPLDTQTNEIVCQECFGQFLDLIGKNNVSNC